ncbi:hypothetical protein NH340_JMT05174 [Sarcoptes scabiei]|nr:hypothetical protein NH340_JMT05174 [Sarcoptes scabiei]
MQQNTTKLMQTNETNKWKGRGRNLNFLIFFSRIQVENDFNPLTFMLIELNLDLNRFVSAIKKMIAFIRNESGSIMINESEQSRMLKSSFEFFFCFFFLFSAQISPLFIL